MGNSNAADAIVGFANNFSGTSGTVPIYADFWRNIYFLQ
jgi:hypothetical protein